MHTIKLEDEPTTKEEKGVKGNINRVLNLGGGTKAKERINCKDPNGKEKQPGAEIALRTTRQSRRCEKKGASSKLSHRQKRRM